MSDNTFAGTGKLSATELRMAEHLGLSSCPCSECSLQNGRTLYTGKQPKTCGRVACEQKAGVER